MHRISLAGPYLRISGAIFVEVFTVQTFTGYIYLGGNPFEMEHIKYVAKVFEAVARAVKSLRSYYHNLCVQKHPKFRPPPPLILQIRGYDYVDLWISKPGCSSIRNLTIMDRCLLRSMAAYPFLSSFVSRTAKLLTRVLAAAGLAPELRYCSRIVGGAFMVIMDLIDGPDADRAFEPGDLPPTVIEDMHNALKKLHEAGLVFGDMRRPNIILVKSRGVHDEDEWHGQLIDFNWSGPVGKARYPPTLNKDGRITWAFGVEPAGLIEKRHDEDMLENIVIGIDSNE